MMATAKLRTSMIQVAPVTRYTMRLGLTGHAHFSSASLLPHSAIYRPSALLAPPNPSF